MSSEQWAMSNDDNIWAIDIKGPKTAYSKHVGSQISNLNVK